MIKALLAVGNSGGYLSAEHLEENLSDVRRQMHDEDSSIADEILDDIKRTLLDHDNKKSGVNKAPVAPNNTTSPGNGRYNRIPSGTNGPCRPILLAYCLGNGFEKRLKEILDHAERCNHSQIYLIANQWGPTVWKRYEQRFHRLPANVTIYLFVCGRLVLLSG